MILICHPSLLDLWWQTSFCSLSKRFFTGSFSCNCILPWFYNFLSLFYRLHIQGTRTIIDNLDTGSSVIPILTRYDGFFDCWNTITREEGRWGLYKGFGALILQYALQLSIIKGSLFTFHHMGDLFKPTGVRPTSPRNQAAIIDRSPQVLSPDSPQLQYQQFTKW